MATDSPTRGIYNIEYFSGSQVAIYIGDIWVDEITSMSYSVSQKKMPIYGYADTLFRTVSKGQVLVQGNFTINFKEAGYLWLILNHYNEFRGNRSKLNPFKSSEDVARQNIEQVKDGEVGTSDRNQMLSSLAAQAALTGFPSSQRLISSSVADPNFNGPPGPQSSVGAAENAFEAFEDSIWDPKTNLDLDHDRRADEPSLNDFDIYLAYGDFAGDNRNNHTIQKITGVHIIGSGKQIEMNGMPIQEEYQFIGKNLI